MTMYCMESQSETRTECEDTARQISSTTTTARPIGEDPPLPSDSNRSKSNLSQRPQLSSRLGMVKMVHTHHITPSNLAYDLAIVILKLIINLFFREIRPRGSHKIPSKGPLIFVAAPHHNQFLDPIILMSEVRAAESARRVSFLIAEKSMKRHFIGLVAKIVQSISVTRAADEAQNGTGTIYLTSNSSLECVIHGHQTKFTTQFTKPKQQIMINSKALGFATVEVIESINDHELKIKKSFGPKVIEALREEGKKIESGLVDSTLPVGIPFKVLPYIDQTQMYSKVYDKLKSGGCLGIFPEGGSHDRTDLLPLKAGVSIMALGAMSANPEIKVRIVPVGLSYFHPHRFRSRAVVEFGTPIQIPQDLVRDFEKGDENKKAAIGKVMDLVHDGLKSVTIQTPDYDTLQVIQAARRLYRPPDRHISLGTVVELNKRFITGYLRYKDEPRVQALKLKTLEYNKSLGYLGLKDHQVEQVSRRWWRSLILLCFRAGLVTGWGILALPGVILNSPMFICASLVSRIKAKEALEASTVKIAGRDVLATWKVLVSLGIAPPLYLCYVAITISIAMKYESLRKYVKWTPLAMLIALPSIGYSALKFGEVGMDVYKSLRPLLLSILGDQKQLERVRKMRSELQEELHAVIEEYAPRIWQNFEDFRIHPSPADLGSFGTKSLSSGVLSADKQEEEERLRRAWYRHGNGGSRSADLISHPLNWLDERLFGWSQSDSRSKKREEQRMMGDDLGEEEDEGSEDGEEEYDEEDEEVEDYDSVVSMLSRFTGGRIGSMGEGGCRSRRSSRNSRSRSQLNLTELNRDEEKDRHGGSEGINGASSLVQNGFTILKRRNRKT